MATNNMFDEINDFMINILEKTDDDKDIIRIQDLHREYRTWYKANYDGKCPTTKDFRSYLRQTIYTYDSQKDCIVYYRFKSIFCTDMTN